MPAGSLLIHVSDLTGGGADSGAMDGLFRRAFIAAGLGAIAAAGAARADGEDDDDGGHGHGDHDRARLAVERGKARPLAEILAKVRPDLGGDVAGVAFRRESGRWVYAFRVIGPDGRVSEVDVDAATAAILGRESR